MSHQPDFSEWGQSPDGRPIRHSKRPFNFENFALLSLGIGAMLMLFLSTQNLMSDSGPLATLKAMLIAGSGGLVAYGVNRMAVDKAAPLWAIGFTWAGVLGVVGILGVGGPMGASTFSGLTIKDVMQRSLENHGAALTQYVGDYDRTRRMSAQVGPGLTVVASDISAWAACEVARNCLSGREGGGRGPIAMTLEALAGKAATVAEQFAAGQSAADRSLAELNAAIASYQKVLDGDDADVWSRQTDLLKIHGQIEQLSGALAQAIPVPLVRAYAAELAAGITIPGRPDVTQRINAILTGHARSLSQILDAGGETKAMLPAFPRRPGVADTLRYIPDFISIAGIVIIAEMVLPLTIFAYTYLRLAYRLECADNGSFPPTPPQAPILPPPSNGDDGADPVRLLAPGDRARTAQYRGRRGRLHGGRR